MCVRIRKIISNIFGPSLDFNDDIIMDNKIDYQENTNKITYKYDFQQEQEEGIVGMAIPKLSQLHILRHERAKLIDSSTTMFGNECTRLVKIAFDTSKIFPSIMGTCDTISQYLQKELQRLYPKKYFHIIIGENDGFSFAISDSDHFADIRQEQYRVLIFSTKPHEKIKMDNNDVNSQMKLRWKSVVIKNK